MLVSKIILFFMFNTVEFADVKDNSYSRVAVYDDLDEYISWAERRVDLLFCKCSSSEMSLAEKIKGIDTGIIQIFPFLGRIADRSLLIEKSLFYQDLFEKEQEEKRQTAEADAAEIEEEEVEEEVLVPPVRFVEPQPEEVIAPPVRFVEPQPEEVIAPPVLFVEPQPEEVRAPPVHVVEPQHEKKDVEPERAQKQDALPKSPVYFPKEGEKIQWENKTVAVLRNELNKAGVKNAFLLTKMQAIEKARRFNAGQLPLSELKRKG